MAVSSKIMRIIEQVMRISNNVHADDFGKSCV